VVGACSDVGFVRQSSRSRLHTAARQPEGGRTSFYLDIFAARDFRYPVMGLGKVLTVLTELVFSAPKHPSHPLQNPCSTRTSGSCRSFVVSSVISDWPLCTTRRATDQSLSLAWVLTEDKMSGLVCVGRPGSAPTFLLTNIIPYLSLQA
jgi:hypothetical protein